jgi:hypothetical protein
LIQALSPLATGRSTSASRPPATAPMIAPKTMLTAAPRDRARARRSPGRRGR